MADRFYTSDALALGEYILSGPEAHHLSVVRRFGPGQSVTLFNGDGREYQAEVVAAGKKTIVLHVTGLETPSRELGHPLVIASALPKGDRADFLVEKLTELGVTEFIPLVSDRAVVKPRDTVVEKFQRAVIEASKQCGRNVLMAIAPPCDWAELLRRPDLPNARYVLHPTVVGRPMTVSQSGVIAAIGPEGGFTDDELAKATAAGWQLLSLGPRILRVETAAISAAVRLSPISGSV